MKNFKKFISENKDVKPFDLLKNREMSPNEEKNRQHVREQLIKIRENIKSTNDSILKNLYSKMYRLLATDPIKNENEIMELSDKIAKRSKMIDDLEILKNNPSSAKNIKTISNDDFKIIRKK